MKPEPALPFPSGESGSLGYLDQSLFELLSDIKNRPSKSFRRELVHAGFAFSFPEIKAEEQNLAESCAQIIEDLHTGSLIIDDIQDNSELRRGSLALHRKYPMPLALNAGNFLYFQALNQVQNLKLADAVKLKIHQQITSVLWEAHQGQALDLHLKVENLSRQELIANSAQITRAKSGALTSLALQMGAIVSSQTDLQSTLQKFGYRFGECLQNFDDLGNLQIENSSSKQLEDLANHRVTYFWSFLAQTATDEILNSFKQWLCDSTPLLEKKADLQVLLEESKVLQKAYQASKINLHNSIIELQSQLRMSSQQEAIKIIFKLAERLVHAYQRQNPSEEGQSESSRDRQWIWGTGNSHSSPSRGLSSPDL